MDIDVKVQSKPCNSLLFSGKVHVVKGTILYKRAGSLFTRRALAPLCGLVTIVKILPHGA